MNLLSTKVKDYFPYHTYPCVENFILLINCILQTRTVCLYKCRDKVPQLKKVRAQKGANENSCYMRLIRFFKMKAVADFIMGIRLLLIKVAETNMEYLIVDRTNWKRGAKSINLLTIGSLMNEVFVPFYWLELNREGGSKLNDRTTLVEGMLQLAQRAGKSLQGSILLADREFIGQNWFEYLVDKNISFVIRLKEKMYFELTTHTGKKNFTPVI
jgi:hypothetical protein